MRVHSALSLLFVLTACDVPTSSIHNLENALPSAARSDAAPVHFVTGGGQYIGSSTEVYGFAVSKDADGNVKGQVQMQLGGLPQFHGEATCLQVDGSSAWIGGAITASGDVSVLPVGTEFWFRVQDNGNGQDPADRISSIRIGFLPASTCNERRPVQVPWRLEHGNIVVR